MMSNIKKYFSLMKYGYQFKLNLLLGVVFILFGLWELTFLFNDESTPMMIVMLMVAPMCMLQSVMTLEIANGVKASPFFEKMYKNLPRCINIIWTIIVDIIYVSIRLYQAKTSDVIKDSLGFEFLLCGILLIVMYVYIAISYRIFIVGTIIFVPIIVVMSYINVIGLNGINITTNQGIIIMAVCSVAAIILYEICHRLVYKMPISRYSTGAFLRKYM